MKSIVSGVLFLGVCAFSLSAQAAHHASRHRPAAAHHATPHHQAAATSQASAAPAPNAQSNAPKAPPVPSDGMQSDFDRAGNQ